MLSSPRLAALVNALIVIGVVVWNGWTATHGFAGNTVGGMSDRYRTAFTPAGYAFSIWGFIFLALMANAIYQLWLAFSADDRASPHRSHVIPRLGPWLMLTNGANVLWTMAWLTEQTALSVLILTSMVAFLTMAMKRLDMARWDAPLETIALVWWPIAIYAGWVTVAVLANLSAFLAKHDVVSGSSSLWAIAMIALAAGYNLYLVARRNLREHAAVAVWALIAIAVARKEAYPTVYAAARAAAGLLLVAMTLHAFVHRRTLPLVRRTPPDPTGAPTH